MLDKFFSKYEGGVKLNPPPSPEKTTLKSPALLGLKMVRVIILMT